MHFSLSMDWYLICILQCELRSNSVFTIRRFWSKWLAMLSIPCSLCGWTRESIFVFRINGAVCVILLLPTIEALLSTSNVICVHCFSFSGEEYFVPKLKDDSGLHYDLGMWRTLMRFQAKKAVPILVKSAWTCSMDDKQR